LLHLIPDLLTFQAFIAKMPATSKIARTLKKPLKACSVILLLFLYLLGSAGIESLHNFLHEQERSALHVVENERDPCHVTIYHDEGNAGCDHASHIVKEDTCSLCDSQLHNAHIILSGVFSVGSVFATTAPLHITYVCVDGVYSNSSGRAPPVL
jgi:hypothetical protein